LQERGRLGIIPSMPRRKKPDAPPAEQARCSRKEILALALALPVLDGAIYSLGFPPASLGAAVFVTPVLTLFAVRRLSLGWAALASFLYGLSGALAVAHWVYTAVHDHYHFGAIASAAFTVGVMGLVVSFYAGTPLLLWRALCGRHGEEAPAWMRGRGRLARPLLAARLWFLFEFLRCHGPLSMAWGVYGAALVSYRVLSQSADVFGVLGLTFFAALTAASLYEAVEAWLAGNLSGALRRVAAAAGVVLILWLYGAFRLAGVERSLAGTRAEAAPLRVAAIQANIAQEDRWQAELVPKNMGVHIEMSKEAAAQGADLIVWPETAMNTYVSDEEGSYGRQIHQIALDSRADFLLGGPAVESAPDGTPRYYNTLFHLEPLAGLTDRYAKLVLLPFAEYNPLGKFSLLPHSKEVPRDYSPGPGPHVFEIRGARVGAFICFEALYPWLARDNVRAGATVLLNVSNDAWFGTTAAAAQHIEQARLRAIETRRYLVRSAGTGISAIVDPTGAYAGDRLEVFTRGILRGEVWPLREETLYARLGDWPLLAFCLGFSALCALEALRRKFLGRRQEALE